MPKKYTIGGYYTDATVELELYSNDLISDRIKEQGRWAPHIHKAVDKYITKDSVVLEAGSYIGAHSVYIAKHCKTLHAFEPLPSSHTTLKRNLELNDLHNVELYTCGLSDKIGSTYFEYVNPENQGVAVLQDTSNPQPVTKYDYSQEKVLLTTIDALKLDQLDFIKLDAEGYELKILEGAIDTIKKYFPTIILEDWVPSRVREKYQILLDLGYEATQISEEENDWLFRKSEPAEATLSVVIPIYLISDDLVELTRECMESIRAYVPAAKIILVDDGSSYKLEEHLDLTDVFVVTHPENLGFATAVNNGIKASKSEYTLVMGNDLKFLNEKPMIEAYNLLKAGSDFVKLCDQTGPDFNHKYQGFNCCLCRTDLYTEIGLLDTKFRQSFEDTDFHVRLEKANKVITVGSPLGLHHHLSATNNKMQVERSEEYWHNFFESQRYFNTKWGYPIDMKNQEYLALKIKNEGAGPVVFIDTNTLFSSITYTGKDLYEGGLGGSETSLIHLAEQFPGSKVYNFTPTEEVYNNVTYLPHTSVPNQPLLIQRSIANLSSVPKDSVLLLHDQVFDDAELLQHHINSGNLKQIAVLSEFHKTLFLEHIGEEYESYIIKHRNGSPFTRSQTVERNKNKFLYAHNPWRGLENLLQMWPAIKLGIPEAELHVFSGGFFESDNETQEYYDWLKVEFSKLPDVYFNGLLPEHELEKEYQSSHLYLYPGTTPETFGISALHAIATGTPIVMNAVWGLIETAPESVAKHAFFTDRREEEFIAHIMRLYYDNVEWEILHNNTKSIDCSWTTVKEELLKNV